MSLFNTRVVARSLLLTLRSATIYAQDFSAPPASPPPPFWSPKLDLLPNTCSGDCFLRLVIMSHVFRTSVFDYEACDTCDGKRARANVFRSKRWRVAHGPDRKKREIYHLELGCVSFCSSESRFLGHVWERCIDISIYMYITGSGRSWRGHHVKSLMLRHAWPFGPAVVRDPAAAILFPTATASVLDAT